MGGVTRDSLKNPDDGKKVMDYIKIMDIVGQLTIDAAKTGEFEDIPEEIRLFLDNREWKPNKKGELVLKNKKDGRKILLPYFMKYLKKNERKRKSEANAMENADYFFCDNDDISKNQAKFSDDDTNLNAICHIIENQIEDMQTDIDSIDFSAESFIKVFCTEKPNETSNLYIRVKEKLKELEEQHNKIHTEFNNHATDNDIDEKASHYRYFYIYAKTELLNVCKLTENKSLNKVLNCIVYAAYKEPNFMNSDGVKNIMWNCFGEEMIQRAKENYEDKEMELGDIDKRVERAAELKKKKLAKYLDERPLCIKELENAEKKYCDIIIREEDIEHIQSVLSAENLKEHKIPDKNLEQLLKLYSVLIVLSKRMEEDKIVGKDRKPCHCIMPLTIKNNSNNYLNYSNIAKLCGFNEYQRKHIKDRLRELCDLGAITINPNDLTDIKIKVVYNKLDISENLSSLVPKDNYKNACKEIIRLVA